jgi:hypothetical protein
LRETFDKFDETLDKQQKTLDANTKVIILMGARQEALIEGVKRLPGGAP